MSEAIFRENKLHDIAFWGLRATIGAIFVVAGSGKFSPGFVSERRIAYGNFLVSKTTKKTFQITPKVGAACAGLVTDMQILSLQIAALAKIRHLELKRDIPPNSIAKRLRRGG